MFSSKKKPGVIPDRNSRCCKCHKKIRPKSGYAVLDGKLYCEKCARWKRDLDRIAFALIMDD